jgi:hypothetical protein
MKIKTLKTEIKKALFASMLLHYKKVLESGIDINGDFAKLIPTAREVFEAFEQDEIFRKFVEVILDSTDKLDSILKETKDTGSVVTAITSFRKEDKNE